MARLRNVTIELMDPDGKILGTIKDVNFLKKQNEKIEGNTISKPTISEILGGLEIDQELKRKILLMFAAWVNRSGEGQIPPNLPQPPKW